MSFGKFRKCFLPEKKLIFFPTFSICRPNPCAYRSNFFYFREIWKIWIIAQISKWTRFSRFCRNLPILEYDEAENGNFRKIVKNQDFQHFGPHICCRSHYRPSEFVRHFRDLEHIRRPYCRKLFFSRFVQKSKCSAQSYFDLSKIRQKLADLA